MYFKNLQVYGYILVYKDSYNRLQKQSPRGVLSKTFLKKNCKIHMKLHLWLISSKDIFVLRLSYYVKIECLNLSHSIFKK